MLEEELETMMTSREPFWPDDQILSQSSCDGQEGPFAKHGKALSSVFVQVHHITWHLILRKTTNLPQVGDNYGTRTTTTVIIGKSGDVRFLEKEWKSGLVTEKTFNMA